MPQSHPCVDATAHYYAHWRQATVPISSISSYCGMRSTLNGATFAGDTIGLAGGPSARFGHPLNSAGRLASLAPQLPSWQKQHWAVIATRPETCMEGQENI